EQAEVEAHQANVTAARAAARRGDWEAALAAYNLAVADNDRPLIAARFGDGLALEVERAAAWFALNDRERLGAELNRLAAPPRAALAPGVALWRGDSVMGELKPRAGGLAVVRRAPEAAAGALTPAERAYANGLRAENPADALEHFEEAVRLEPFYHRGNMGLAL